MTRRHVRSAAFSLILVVAALSFAGENPTRPVVEVRFIDVCPDRSLPILWESTWALQALESEGNSSVYPPNATVRTNDRGWKSIVEPSGGYTTFDEHRLVLFTNEPERAIDEAGGIFRTLGFLPVDPLDSWSPERTEIQLFFAGDLVFLGGETLPVIVLKREESTGAYGFLSRTPVTLGQVTQKSLGARSVFVFEEDHSRVLAGMRRERPTGSLFFVWDERGAPAFRSGYDGVAWHGDSFEVMRNTMSLEAPCSADRSALKCGTSANACHYSLLHPVSGVPMVLQTTVTIAYVDDVLMPTGVSLRLTPAESYDGFAVTCARFGSIDEILDRGEFGYCGANIDGVREYRCLGTAEGFIRESKQFSKLYWLNLRKQVAKVEREFPVYVESDLQRLLDGLGPNDDLGRFPDHPPHGFGHRDSYGFEQLVADEKP